MSWYEKQKPTPFDIAPIDGLLYLDGDILARILMQHWTKGQKLPLIAFDSGLEFELWESGKPDRHLVHLFGEMDLPLQQNRDTAYRHATSIAEQIGYLVTKIGENQLVIVGYELDEYLLLTYDNAAERLVNVERSRIPQTERPKHPGHILMNDEIKKHLPPLYSGEQSGEHLNAKAVVKYFHPLSGWTWYASEFDGKDLFFGVVDGFEVELGYFTLSELEGIGEETGLPIERDLYYTPQILQEILDYHRRQRRP